MSVQEVLATVSFAQLGNKHQGLCDSSHTVGILYLIYSICFVVIHHTQLKNNKFTVGFGDRFMVKMFVADLLSTTAAEVRSVTPETVSTTVAFTQTSESTDILSETVGNRDIHLCSSLKLHWVQFVVDLLDLDWNKILLIWCMKLTTTSCATNPQPIEPMEFEHYALFQIIDKISDHDTQDERPTQLSIRRKLLPHNCKAYKNSFIDEFLVFTT